MSRQSPDLPRLTPDNFTNRELSTIQFNRRVLALAQDPNIPLLERIKFIAIVGNNLDEFFMVRVAGHVQKQDLGINVVRADGHTPAELVAEIRRMTTELIKDQRTALLELLRELEQH